MKRITDLRTAKAILTKICLENDVDVNDVWFNPKYKYIENTIGKKDVSFLKTKWYGFDCQVRYVDGCFNPYLFLM